MCTVLLPPGVNPIVVNKYTIYHIIYNESQRITIPAIGLEELKTNSVQSYEVGMPIL